MNIEKTLPRCSQRYAFPLSTFELVNFLFKFGIITYTLVFVSNQTSAIATIAFLAKLVWGIVSGPEIVEGYKRKSKRKMKRFKNILEVGHFYLLFCCG